MNYSLFTLTVLSCLFCINILQSCKEVEKEKNTIELNVGKWNIDIKHPESIAFDGTYFYIPDFGDVLAPHLKNGQGSIWKVDMNQQIVSTNIAKVLLHKPKGLIVINDLILVNDIDSLKAINKHTGALVYAIDFLDVGVDLTQAGGTGLNDIVKGKNNNTVFVSITNNGKIYKIDLTTKSKKEIATVPAANGLTYDKKNNLLYANGYTNQPSLSKIDLNMDYATTLLENAYVGKGGLDGLALIDDDMLVISDWGAGANGSNEVGSLVKYNLNTKTTQAIDLTSTFKKEGLNGPADFLVLDNYVLIPALGEGGIYALELE